MLGARALAYYAAQDLDTLDVGQVNIHESRCLANVDGHGRNRRLWPLAAGTDTIQVEPMDDEAAGAAIANARAVVDKTRNRAAQILKIRDAPLFEIVTTDRRNIDRCRQRGRLAPRRRDYDITRSVCRLIRTARSWRSTAIAGRLSLRLRWREEAGSSEQCDGTGSHHQTRFYDKHQK